MIFSPYTTSNENIAYPFLPSDSIAYKDESVSEAVSNNKLPSSFLVDIAFMGPSIESVRVRHMWGMLPLLRTMLALEVNGYIWVHVYLPFTNIVPYKRWYKLDVLYTDGGAPVERTTMYILPGSSYMDVIHAVRLNPSRWLQPVNPVYFEHNTLSEYTPSVLDFTLPDLTVVSPDTGVVKLLAGYNIDLALQSMEESLPGDSIISSLEAPETGISMAASAGAGEGKVPCDVEPVDPDGIVRKIQGVTPDADGNVTIRTDDCYRVEPDPTDPNGLILTGDCVACCECEDYYDAMTYLQKQFRYGGKLSAFGFATEYNTEVKLLDGSTKPNDLFIEASSESDPTLKYRREGGYSLHFVPKVLHGNNYHRWEYYKDGNATPTYFSTATENGAIPLGVLWYSYAMGDDVYTEDNPYSVTCRPVKESEIHPISADNKGTIPAGFSVYITNTIPIGLCKIRDAMTAMHSQNKESYQISVQMWNALELATTSVSSVSAWLTAGSYRLDSFGVEKDDLKGFRHAVLNVRMLALANPATIAWIWSTQQDSTYTYTNIRDTYFYLNANFNLMSGPVDRRTPYARLSIVSRQPKVGKTPPKTARWEMEYGIVTCTIDGPSVASSVITVNGIDLHLVSASNIGLDGMAMRFAVNSTTMHPRLDFLYSAGKQKWEYRFKSGLTEVVYHTQDFTIPISTVVDSATYYSVVPPWQVYYDSVENPVSPSPDMRPETVRKVYAEVGA